VSNLGFESAVGAWDEIKGIRQRDTTTIDHLKGWETSNPNKP